VEEESTRDDPFQRYIYFIIITGATLGYGNPYEGPINRVSVMLLIIISLFIIPAKSSRLVSILSSKSAYARLR
jgi:hypothetical protein